MRGFVANRLRRRLPLLLLFWPVNYVLVARLWVWNMRRTTLVTVRQAIASLPPEYWFAHGVLLLHLWFLYFLLIFCLAVALVRPVLARWPTVLVPVRQVADRELALVLRRWWAGLALGLLLVWPMLGMRSSLGADTPEHSLWPSFFLYAVYFGIGWLLQRQPALLGNLRSFRGANQGLSLLFIGALFALKLRFDFRDPLVAGQLLPTVNFLYAFTSMATVLAFWASCWLTSPGITRACATYRTLLTRFILFIFLWLFFSDSSSALLLALARQAVFHFGPYLSAATGELPSAGALHLARRAPEWAPPSQLGRKQAEALAG